MISIPAWNDGYETHDTKRTKGRLSWVRQNVLISEVCWAKLWLRPDAAQVWAGWTAIVWCAAQSDERGTISSVEDVAILSRVPEEMVSLGLEWGISCGFATFDDLRADCAHDAHIPRADCATTRRDGTGRDGTGQDVTKKTLPVLPRAWPPGLDPTRQPSRQVFLDAVRVRFPDWQPGPVERVYEIWADNSWKDGDGKRIGNWQGLAAIWYKRADQTDKFEKLPPGSFFPGAESAAEQMRIGGNE